MSGFGKSIKSVFDWKTWALIGFGGTTVIFGTALVTQWDSASLGRQVSRNVKRFLRDTGSQISNGMITGGRLKTPMKVNTAINALIVQMLNEAFDEIEQRGGAVGGVGPSSSGQKDDDIEYPTYTSAPPPRVSASSMVGGEGGLKRQKAVSVSAPVSTRMASERKKKRTSAHCMEVSKLMVDDGGYGDSPGGRSGSRSKSSFEYNPNEFSPAGRQGGACPRKSVFTDDEGAGEGGDDDDEYQ